MDNAQLRKEALKYLDEMTVGEHAVEINSKELAEEIKAELGLDVNLQSIHKAVEYLIDKGFLSGQNVSTFDTPDGTTDYMVKSLTAEARDYLEGKTESGKGGFEVNLGDVNADMVAIGQDISQEKIVDKMSLKEAIDKTEELGVEEKASLKESIDRLEKEIEKTSPDKTIIGEILGQVKEKGVDLLIGLTASYLYQKFLTGI